MRILDGESKMKIEAPKIAKAFISKIVSPKIAQNMPIVGAGHYYNGTENTTYNTHYTIPDEIANRYAPVKLSYPTAKDPAWNPNPKDLASAGASTMIYPDPE